MQTNVLLSSICSKIDKLTRKFLRGSTEHTRKLHLVMLDTICKSKDEGGLNFKPFMVVNKAYMAKLGCQILTNPQALWVKILRHKYLKGGYILQTHYRRNGTLPTWRCILASEGVLRSSVGWSLENGSNVKFWTDSWLENMGTVASNVTQSVPQHIITCSVFDMVKN